MKIDLEKLYLSLPYIFQLCFLNLQSLIIFRRRYNSDFFTYLNSYSKSNPEIVNINDLRKFLVEAEKTIFWKKIFKKYNFKVKKFNDLKNLEKLPILNKKIVKENINDIINLKYLNTSKNNHTSGTTGSGLIFPETREMENRQWAIWWRYRIKVGIKFGTWCGWFGGRSILNLNKKSAPYWINNYPMRMTMFSAHHLNSKTVKFYYDKICDKKLSWLHGYPSQITLLSNLIIENNLEINDSVKYITFGAENFLESQRIIIKKVFKAEIYQHYGLSEGVSNISLNTSNEFIPDQDFAYSEFISKKKLPKNQYHIIGTNYYNFAFPLIRYDTGDILTTYDNKNFKIKSIDGRNEDYITLKNGAKLGRLDHIFKDIINVEEAQILQESLDEIIVNIVPNKKFNKIIDEKLIISEFQKRTGKYLSINIRYQKKIKRTKNGKLKFVISKL
jgi:phenylacetate-CoA ligase